MKVNVILVVGGEQRSVVIPCGNGEKTFKWLSLVATQRFALFAPIGQIRCRESVRGTTESAQHQILSLRLEGGDAPLPSALLTEFLHDGDTVYVDLDTEQKVDSVGNAKTSAWYDEAFKNSEHDEGRPPPLISGEVEFDFVDHFSDSPGSKVMRNLLRTQMLDGNKVSQALNRVWPAVSETFPRLSAADNAKIKSLCQFNYCYLFELFKHYSPLEPEMDEEAFVTFVCEVSIFGPSSSSRAKVIFSRALSTRPDKSTMDFSAFLASLILCAQQLHVNTLDKDARVLTSAGALGAVITDLLMPLIFKLELNYVSKDRFSSAVFLEKLWEHHGHLVLVFEKTASRSGSELPVSLHIEHMADLLVEVGLLKGGEHNGRIEVLNSYLINSRKGLLQGEPYLRLPSISTDAVDKQRAQNLRRNDDYDLVENIITYPEFVEVVARAGAAKFSKGLMKSDLSVPEKIEGLMVAMIRGVSIVGDVNRKRPPTPTKGSGFSRGGK